MKFGRECIVQGTNNHHKNEHDAGMDPEQGLPFFNRAKFPPPFTCSPLARLRIETT